MTKHNFSFQDLFMFGWSKTKQHAWFITLTFIIISIINRSASGIPVISFVVTFMIGISVTSIALLMSRDQHFTFADLYMPLLSQKRVLKFIALGILYMLPIIMAVITLSMFVQGIRTNNGVFAALGLLLFIPALLFACYTSIRFKFFPFIAIEHENATVLDLIKMSGAFTRGRFLTVLVFVGMVAGINLVPVIFGSRAPFFLLGLFVTIPLSILSTAHLYNKFKEHATIVNPQSLI